MNDIDSTCKLLPLSQFLENKLTVEEQGQLESHLDRCDQCCDRLRRMTAAADQWSEVRENLVGANFDELITGSVPATSPVSLDFLQPTDDPRMLGRFAGYEIIGVIGAGGMGIVLKGLDQSLNRYVAIKVLLPHYASSAAARQRFAREAQAAAAVVHQNVIGIYGVSVGENAATLPYLVMPYIRGESLQKRLDRTGALAIEETLRIAIQIASGLAAAHEQGLVHRDIKPANILLPEDVDRVTLTDFGLARAADDASLTRTGVVAGTPQYMSPEQAESGVITGQSDLFSLGSVMYAMCTGRVPFRAETPLGILRRIVDEDPRPIRQINPELPKWLCRIVERLHAKNPDARFKSAAELAQLLKQCLAHVQQPEAVPLPCQVDPGLADTSVTGHAFLNYRFLTGAVVMGLILLFAIFGWPFFETNPWSPVSATFSNALQEQQPFKKQFTVEFADPSKIGTVNVDIKRGSIVVVGHDQQNVIVDLEVPHYTRESTGSDGLREIRSNNLDFDITTTGNRIKVDSDSQHYITNLVIKVPRESNLVLDSYRDGKLQVTGVRGHLDARSFHNDITLTECSGSANVWSYHGDLLVGLNSRNADSALSFESYNGSIDLSLPTDIRASTQLRTNHGKLLTDFDITEVGDPVQAEITEDGSARIQFDKFVRGTINGGGQVLKVNTEHGDIKIRKKEMRGLGERLGREWDEKLGRKLGEEINRELGPKLGKQWNEKLNPELGREWSDRLNRQPQDDHEDDK